MSGRKNTFSAVPPVFRFRGTSDAYTPLRCKVRSPDGLHLTHRAPKGKAPAWEGALTAKAHVSEIPILAIAVFITAFTVQL